MSGRITAAMQPGRGRSSIAPPALAQLACELRGFSAAWMPCLREEVGVSTARTR
eukprot:CAMPEP_0175441682 /NCGR_PEP_ID=MMETSP0095-20121207/57735_1 /TAXON_ID=311494 /ORGANISM="Alexandrium monilatum, Strain CCMP3105" /LENGTH=53 /DNA_ID=CAMNT_0016741641 /DNA_START=18 /DNA_END=175 /DNA_ORIENTATION=-